jgi:hypothetical protein
MFTLTGQIGAGGAGVMLALGGLGAPAATDRALEMPHIAPISLTAGHTTRFDLPVHNSGTVPATGAVLSLVIDPRFLGKTSYRNCSTGDLGLHCTFDTTLEAGRYYGLSEPLAFRPPADSITGSTVRTMVTWWTAKEYAALPVFRPGDHPPGSGGVWTSPLDPRWSARPELRLTELAGPPAAPPPARVWDEWLEEYVDAEPSLDMTVTRGRSADLEVSGVQTVGRNGRGGIRASLVNHGPGRLYPDTYADNSLMISVTTPASTRITSAPKRCWLPSDGWLVECSSTASLARDTRENIDLRVRVNKPTSHAGRVEIVEDQDHPLALDDPDRSNNTAPIDPAERRIARRPAG